MIAAWMLFATVVGLSFGIAAVAAERAWATVGGPRRVAWASALGATLLLPAFAWVRASHGETGAIAGAVLPAVIVNAGMDRVSHALTLMSLRQLASRLDALLVVAWLILSGFLLVRLALSMLLLARQRRTWRRARVDGAEVRFSPDVGPAVVGLRHMDIVLPEWTTALEMPLRALVLTHEDEHRRAGDPLLVMLGAVAAIVMPWNPALHWQARRLRLALEMDCDARVLREHPHAERYGLLLLTIAQRRSASLPSLAPALSEPVSHLERRIMAMRNAARISAAKIILLAAAAMAAVVVACSVDAPSAARSPGARSNAARAATPTVTKGRYFEFQVEKRAAQIPGSGSPRYPTLLRTADVEGEVLAQFVVDTNGRAESASYKVLKSTHALFTLAVREALPNMRFYPAEVGGRKVRQLVQMPFVFSLSKNR